MQTTHRPEPHTKPPVRTAMRTATAIILITAMAISAVTKQPAYIYDPANLQGTLTAATFFILLIALTSFTLLTLSTLRGHLDTPAQREEEQQEPAQETLQTKQRKKDEPQVKTPMWEPTHRPHF